MELLFLAAGLVVGGLLTFFIAKRCFGSKSDDGPAGMLIIEYFDPEERPNIFLALDVEPDEIAKKKHVRLKITKHHSHK